MAWLFPCLLDLKTYVYNEHMGHFTVLPLKSRAYIVTTCCTMHTVCTAVYGFMFIWVPVAYRYIGLLYVQGKYKNMCQYFLMLHTADTKKWSDHDSLSQENYTLGSQIEKSHKLTYNLYFTQCCNWYVSFYSSDKPPLPFPTFNNYYLCPR